MDKAPDAFRTISEVADDLDIPQHVLRFWETRFAQIKPMKRGGGRRYYRPADVDLLRGIKHLLYGEGYTIKGVQRILREDGVKHVQSIWTDEANAEEETVAEPSKAKVAEVGAAALPAEKVEPRTEPVAARPAERRPTVASFVETDEDDDEGEDEDAAVAADPVSVGSGLSDDQRTQLTAVLAELKECRRLLKTASETAR